MRTYLIAALTIAIMLAAGAIDASTVSIDVRQQPITEVLRELARQTGTSVLWAEELEGAVTLKLQEQDLELALQLICLPHNYTFTKLGVGYVIERGAAATTGARAVPEGADEPHAAATDDLVLNGGFEEEEHGWRRITSSDGAASGIQTKDVHSGKMTCLLTGPATTEPIGLRTEAPLPLVGGAEYSLEMFYKFDTERGQAPPALAIVLDFVGAGGRALPGCRLIQAAGAQAEDWTGLQRTFIAPESAEQAHLSFLCRQEGGTALVDDIALRGTGREAAPAGEQLAANGGLEDGASGLPEGWSVEIPGGAFGPPELAEHLGHGKFSWGEGARRSGQRALHVENYDRRAEERRDWIQMVPIDVNADDTYTLEFWGRRHGECEADVLVDLVYGAGDAGGVEAAAVAQVPVTSTEWARYQAELQPAVAMRNAPEGGSASGALILRAGLLGAGRAWFDDFALVRREAPRAPEPAVAATPPTSRPGRATRPRAGAAVSAPSAAAAARRAVGAANRRTNAIMRGLRGGGGALRDEGTEGWQR